MADQKADNLHSPSRRNFLKASGILLAGLTGILGGDILISRGGKLPELSPTSESFNKLVNDLYNSKDMDEAYSKLIPMIEFVSKSDFKIPGKMIEIQVGFGQQGAAQNPILPYAMVYESKYGDQNLLAGIDRVTGVNYKRDKKPLGFMINEESKLDPKDLVSISITLSEGGQEYLGRPLKYLKDKYNIIKSPDTYGVSNTITLTYDRNPKIRDTAGDPVLKYQRKIESVTTYSFYDYTATEARNYNGDVTFLIFGTDSNYPGLNSSTSWQDFRIKNTRMDLITDPGIPLTKDQYKSLTIPIEK
jgi:hypothetical protein